MMFNRSDLADIRKALLESVLYTLAFALAIWAINGFDTSKEIPFPGIVLAYFGYAAALFVLAKVSKRGK
jgi:hypothetical protein